MKRTQSDRNVDESDRGSEAAFELRHIWKSYATLSASAQVAALQDINLTIAEGSVVSIVGASGCGKSTLLRILAGLIPATSGRVLHRGVAVASPAPERGMVFQADSVFPWLTVGKNVEFGLRARGLGARERARIAEEWCATVGLSDFIRSFPKELSGGMRKRVDLARSYANDPDVLLMDEPFGALDAQTKMEMQNEVLRLWRSTRKTVVFVTHDLEEATYLSDTVIVMSRRPGRIAAKVTVRLERPRTETLRVSTTFAEAKREVWEEMQVANRLGHPSENHQC